MLLLDYQKTVQPFSFLRILFKNDKIIAQILQKMAGLVIDSYSSPTWTYFTPLWLKLELGKRGNAARTVKIHQLFNLYRAKYEPNAFCGFVVNDLFYVMYSEYCILRCVKKEYLFNILTQLTVFLPYFLLYLFNPVHYDQLPLAAMYSLSKFFFFFFFCILMNFLF